MLPLLHSQDTGCTKNHGLHKQRCLSFECLCRLALSLLLSSTYPKSTPSHPPFECGLSSTSYLVCKQSLRIKCDAVSIVSSVIKVSLFEQQVILILGWNDEQLTFSLWFYFVRTTQVQPTKNLRPKPFANACNTHPAGVFTNMLIRWIVLYTIIISLTIYYSLLQLWSPRSLAHSV